MTATPDDFVQSLCETMFAHRRRLALTIGDVTWTYGDLLDAARRSRDALRRDGFAAGALVPLQATQTAADYARLLGAWLAGCAYVPLHAATPATRAQRVLTQLAPLPARASPGPRALAYLMFTSGSTGLPKGVPIDFDNLRAFARRLHAWCPAGPDDRILHTSSLAFDLSVLELLLAWENGASLCAVPHAGTLFAARHAAERGVTIWVSVPSTVGLAHDRGLLPAGSLARIRHAVFCGEPLTRRHVMAFAAAAPAASIDNLWGPTEATVALTREPVSLGADLPEIVPIGRPEVAGEVVCLGERGELHLRGPQVMRGYWRDPRADAAAFTTIGGQRWYRTGDLAEGDARGGFRFLGRADRQVKLRGYRIELGDCEAALREVAGVTMAAVVTAPGERLVAFVAAAERATGAMAADAIARELGRRLPPYMRPAEIRLLRGLPINASGKIDYPTLGRLARESSSNTSS